MFYQFHHKRFIIKYIFHFVIRIIKLVFTLSQSSKPESQTLYHSHNIWKLTPFKLKSWLFSFWGGGSLSLSLSFPSPSHSRLLFSSLSLYFSFSLLCLWSPRPLSFSIPLSLFLFSVCLLHPYSALSVPLYPTIFSYPSFPMFFSLSILCYLFLT